MRIRTSHPWASSPNRSSHRDRVEPIASSRALVVADARPFYQNDNPHYADDTSDVDYASSSCLAAQMLVSDCRTGRSSAPEAEPYSKAIIAYKSMAALPHAQSLGFSRSL
jgi:hypothetical protein